MSGTDFERDGLIWTEDEDWDGRWLVEAKNWQLVIRPHGSMVRVSWIESDADATVQNEDKYEIDTAYAVAKGLIVSGKVAARDE